MSAIKAKTIARIELPQKLIPIFTGNARYRGAFGGRGSGKTRSFAKMAAVKAFQLSSQGEEGLILCAREFMNSLEESSFAELKAAILSEPWLERHFEIGERFIRTKDRRVSFGFAGLHHNIHSIKSKARVRLLWVDEAEHVSEAAWMTTIPTIREDDSEIWVTWNPERPSSATHKRFRINAPNDAKITELNWRDNPWFPDVLNRERCADLANRPEYYAHIWEGDFLTAVEGAYYAKALQNARAENRISRVKADPLMAKRAFWDIGGSGAKADATAIWIAQFIGREIRILDYYEAQGQPLATHIAWLRKNDYENALMTLPHDGSTHDRVHDVSFESALREAGFEVQIIANQGAGAARLRIEAARRLFPLMWFDEEKTQGGLEALRWYHEKRDENRSIGLGPVHDWSSHAADAFGLMCIAYEQPSQTTHQSRYHHKTHHSASWMAG